MDIIFIQRYFKDRDYSEQAQFCSLHIAERTVNPDLPKWRKMPLCRNGFNLKSWDFVTLDPVNIHPSQVCAKCRQHLSLVAAVSWGGPTPTPTERGGG